MAKKAKETACKIEKSGRALLEALKKNAEETAHCPVCRKQTTWIPYQHVDDGLGLLTPLFDSTSSYRPFRPLIRLGDIYLSETRAGHSSFFDICTECGVVVS